MAKLDCHRCIRPKATTDEQDSMDSRGPSARLRTSDCADRHHFHDRRLLLDRSFSRTDQFLTNVPLPLPFLSFPSPPLLPFLPCGEDSWSVGLCPLLLVYIAQHHYLLTAPIAQLGRTFSTFFISNDFRHKCIHLSNLVSPLTRLSNDLELPSPTHAQDGHV